MTHTSTRRGSCAATIALAIALPGCGAAPTPPIHAAPAAEAITTPSRETRLREFRHMIVGLHRVAPARGDDPIDALWRSLTAQYGRGMLMPRPEAGSGRET